MIGRKRPGRIYHFRGQVERIRRRAMGWRDGYSATGPGGGILYPWMTRKECQIDAKQGGYRAAFYREGEPEREAR